MDITCIQINLSAHFVKYLPTRMGNNVIKSKKYIFNLYLVVGKMIHYAWELNISKPENLGEVSKKFIKTRILLRKTSRTRI